MLKLRIVYSPLVAPRIVTCASARSASFYVDAYLSMIPSATITFV